MIKVIHFMLFFFFYHNPKKRSLQRERSFELNNNMSNYNKLVEEGTILGNLKPREHLWKRIELGRYRIVTNQQLV